MIVCFGFILVLIVCLNNNYLLAIDSWSSCHSESLRTRHSTLRSHPRSASPLTSHNQSTCLFSLYYQMANGAKKTPYLYPFPSPDPYTDRHVVKQLTAQTLQPYVLGSNLRPATYMSVTLGHSSTSQNLQILIYIVAK